MGLFTVSTEDFPIRCVVAAGPRGSVAYEALHLGIVAALGLGSQVTPQYTSVRATMPNVPRDGERLEGFGRICGVRGVTTDGHKVAMIAYSFFYTTHHGAYVLRSSDLDDSPYPAYRKPNELWLRDGDRPVVLSDELRAKIEALAPKKVRAGRPRVAR